MKYARSNNHIVVQIIGNEPANLFAPEYAALFRPCDDTVSVGWLDDGQAFSAPPIKPTPIPQVVTMRQARLALLGAGNLAAVNAAIAAMTGIQGDTARIEWEFSSDVIRTQPLVAAMGQALGLTDAQLNTLFVIAATL